jgi:hypothetical protein
MSAETPQFTELDGAIEQLAIAEKRARKAERELHRLERQLAGSARTTPIAAEVQGTPGPVVAEGQARQPERRPRPRLDPGRRRSGRRSSAGRRWPATRACRTSTGC